MLLYCNIVILYLWDLHMDLAADSCRDVNSTLFLDEPISHPPPDRRCRIGWQVENNKLK